MSEEIHQLKEKVKQLTAETEKLAKERDELLGFLYALTRKEFDFDKDELFAMVDKQKPFLEFIAELEEEHGG